MAHDFVFALRNHFQLVSVQEAKAIAEATIAEADPEELPPKFQLCIDAANKMMATKPVSRTEFTAMMDVIGGYFSAMVVFCEDHEGDPEQLAHAKELMRFADQMIELVRPVWGLSVVRP